jgi:hypothetical protein
MAIRPNSSANMTRHSYIVVAFCILFQTGLLIHHKFVLNQQTDGLMDQIVRAAGGTKATNQTGGTTATDQAGVWNSVHINQTALALQSTLFSLGIFMTALHGFYLR